jgi:aquaglyceroporin related protein
MADEIHLNIEKIRDIPVMELRLTSLGRLRHAYRDYIAEFWGTFIMILFGDGVIAQTVLSKGDHGNQVTINICWGIAVIIGIYTSGGISGAHLNPAVTLTLAMFRKFPWKRVTGYWIAQGAGAFVASAVLYANYMQAFNTYDGGIRAITGSNASAGIFATYPAKFMTVEGAFFDEFLATGLLVFGIFAINDLDNTGAGNLGPFMIGLLVIAIGMAFGWQTGYAVNPARDLAPRLFTYLVYGNDVFTVGSDFFSNYSLIPIFAPIFGAPIGAFLYDLFMYTGESPLQKFFQYLP